MRDMYNFNRHPQIKRGDIWFVRGGKAVVGSEPMGDRPAVIVSNDKGNATSPNVEVVYLTSKEKKAMPTHVPVVARTQSTALCENIQTVSKERLENFIRSCTDKEMDELDKALLHSLGLTLPVPVAEPYVATEVSTDNTADVELTVYKRLYEQLLDRVMGAKV